MNYAEMVEADRRLVILKLLQDSAGYACNEHLLGALLGSFGHLVPSDRLRTDLAWLAEQSLIQVAEVGGIEIATISQRGLDVANGRAHVPGVKRPTPGA